MRNVSKLSTGILAVAMVLMCSANMWAQQLSTANGASQKQMSASDQLRMFTPDASNPELSNLQISMLKTKVLLESGQANNKLSKQEVADLKAQIAVDASQINSRTTGDKKEAGMLSAERKITRADFSTMSADNQKNVLTNIKGIEISDLVNATPADLNQRQDGKFYIPVSQLATSDMQRMQQILSNPSTYIVVKEASMIPKIQVSKAALENMSPEKKAAIKGSNDFVITD
jgi:hypothetical protein